MRSLRVSFLLRACLVPLLLAACGESNGVDTGGAADTGVTADGALGDGLLGDGGLGDGGAGDGGGDAAEDVPPANQAPQLTIVAPVADTVVTLGETVAVEVTLSDDGPAGQNLAVVLTSSAAAAPLYESATATAGTVAFSVPAALAGKQTWTVQVTDAQGLSAQAAVAIFVNTAPGAPQVEIAPANPKTADDLVATVIADAGDVDRADSELTYSYEWLLDGVATGLTGATLPAAQTAKGQKWTVVVQAKDPYATGPEGSADVVIGNTAPTAVELALAPTEVDLAATVTCTLAAAATDTDGDEIAYTYAWSIDGVSLPGATSETLDLLTLPGAGVLAKAGQALTCQVVVTDGTDTLAPAQSPAVTLGAFDVCGSALNPCDLAADCANTDTLAPLCACKPGYAGDGKSCADVDECASGTAGCDAQATCANTIGSFTCTCNAGWAGDGTTCADVDECADGTAGCDLAADCSNTAGSFTCTCKPGYSGDGKTCSDVDECADGTAGCDLAAECSNSVGSFTCTCKPGYSGDGKTCSDVDECADGTAGCDAAATCANSVGSFACTCKPGYVGDGKTCADIDECASDNGGCGDAKYYSCANQIGGAPVCTDIDECKADNGGCGDAQFFTCTNEIGKDPVCADIDECQVANGGCGDAQFFSCANEIGKPPVCADIDECKTDNGGCGDAQFYSCANEVGKPPVCADIDECKTANGGCGDAQFYSCANEIGKPPVCADIDECKTANGGCGAATAWTCVNNVGKAPTCNDIDECAASYAPNWSGGLDGWQVAGGLGDVKWQAAKGGLYYGNLKTGTFDTPDKANGGTATSPAFVVNADAALSFSLVYDVETDAGYDKLWVQVLDGASTTNVLDKTKMAPAKVAKVYTASLAAWAGKKIQVRFFFETVDHINNDGSGVVVSNLAVKTVSPCGVNATCSNAPGSYTCQCNAFWTGDGVTCSDLDECQVDNGGCGDAKYNTCSNQVGKAPVCADIDECKTDNGGCGDPKFTTCANVAGKPPVCTDIDECKTDNGGCGDAKYTTCTNVAGKPPVCADIDECQIKNGGCGDPKYTTCTNVAGKPPVCADIDECKTDNGGCGDPKFFACTNVAGKPPVCADIDECKTKNGGCGAPTAWTCTNNVGKAPTCTDIDECTAAYAPNWSAGLDGWQAAGGSGAVKWQAHQGALYYGNPASGTYDSGTANAGTATSGVLLVNANAVLAFSLKNDVESDPDFDKLAVQVLDGGNTTTVLDKTKMKASAQVLPYTASLAPWAGKKIQIRFAFATGDKLANSTSGVWVSNLTVKTVSPCGTNATCTNKVGSYSCACNGGWTGDGLTCKQLKTVTFGYTGGNQGFTVPAGVTELESVTLVGAGGGGGGNDGYGGAAGGKGGKATASKVAVQPGQGYVVVVGRGGNGGGSCVAGSGGGAGGFLGGGGGGNAGPAGCSGGGGGGAGLTGLFLGSVSAPNALLIAGGGGGGGGGGNQAPQVAAAASPGGSVAGGAFATGGKGANKVSGGCSDGGGGGGGGSGMHGGGGGAASSLCDRGGFSGGGGSSFAKAGLSAALTAGGGNGGGGTAQKGADGSVQISYWTE